jgi:hypothetical protein
MATVTPAAISLAISGLFLGKSFLEKYEMSMNILYALIIEPVFLRKLVNQGRSREGNPLFLVLPSTYLDQ